MPRLLFIVSVYRPDVYHYAAEAFRGVTENVEVVLDRRAGERRLPVPGALEPERRQSADRRRQQIDDRLQSVGWAVVPSHEASAGPESLRADRRA